MLSKKEFRERIKDMTEEEKNKERYERNKISKKKWNDKNKEYFKNYEKVNKEHLDDLRSKRYISDTVLCSCMKHIRKPYIEKHLAGNMHNKRMIRLNKK